MHDEQADLDYDTITGGQPCQSLDTQPGVELVGKGQQRLIMLALGSNLIGRDEQAQVSLSHPAASRRHAEIRLRHGGGAMVVDLGSTNGTYVNGARIKRKLLHEGDRIRIGSVVVLRYGQYPLEQVFSQQLTGSGALSESLSSVPLPLSVREREVALLVADGLSNPVIAARLNISARTVGAHLNNIYKRMGIHSRVQLTRLVLAHGQAQIASSELTPGDGVYHFARSALGRTSIGRPGRAD